MGQATTRIASALGATCQGFLSLGKVLLRSSFCTRGLTRMERSSDEIVVLGNGPSLRILLDEHADFLAGKELLAVNYAVQSPSYETLRPRYYVAIDPVVFSDEAFCKRLFEPLAEKTVWPLELFVPYNVRREKKWKAILSNNPFITIHYINTTPVAGADWIAMPLFRRRLGMPSPRNVLVPSLMVALWAGFRTVYTAGVDHSWHLQLRVDDQNRLMINDTHYYDASDPGYTRHGTFTVGMLFRSLSLAFNSYHTVNRFARRLGRRIVNITPGSFIDAFERMKL